MTFGLNEWRHLGRDPPSDRARVAVSRDRVRFDIFVWNVDQPPIDRDSAEAMWWRPADADARPRQFTGGELLRCALRETSLRERVYPRFVSQKTMTAQDARRELLMMKEIVEVLRRLARDESPTQDLPFG